MKQFGKWLVVMIEKGEKSIIYSGKTKKELIEYLNFNARQEDAQTWSNGENRIFTIEKNTEEFKF